MDIRDLPESLFAPVTRYSAIEHFYIAPRDERDEGIVFIMRGKQRCSVDMKVLLKKYRTLENKPIKARKLVGGRTYWFRAPSRGEGTAFIVPKSGNYAFNGKVLKPMTCVVLSGDISEVMPYVLFRAQYRMLPNAVSSRKFARNLSAVGTEVKNSAKFSNSLVATGVEAQTPLSRRPPQHVYSEYTPLARLVRNGKPMGLQLRNTRGQVNRIGMDKCVMWAREGKIAGVKAVTRNNVSFVAGVGFSLESLPQLEV